MSIKQIPINYVDTGTEVVTFRLQYEDLPAVDSPNTISKNT